MKTFLKDVWVDVLIAIPLLWTTLWACAVDTPGKRGEIAILMVLIGLAAMGFVVFGIPAILDLFDKKDRAKAAKQIISQTNNITQRRKSKWRN